MKKEIEKSIGSTLQMLGIVFVVLKLTGLIDWSWWLVALPFYVMLPISAILYLIIIINEKLKE